MGTTIFGVLTDMKEVHILKLTDTPGKLIQIFHQCLPFAPTTFPNASCGLAAMMRIMLASPEQLGHNLKVITVGQVTLQLHKVLGAGNAFSLFITSYFKFF